jgi:nicotinamide mononucleotide transporter
MLKDAFSGWSKYSTITYALGAGLIIGQTLSMTFEWMHIFSMVASLLGYLSVTLIVNNKRLNGWAGLISAAMFFYIGWQAGNPADALLNVAFILMLDAPVILSKKWGDTSKVHQIKESKNPAFWLILTPIIFIAIFGAFYLMEIHLQTARPVMDSLAAALGLTASVLTVAQISDAFYIWAIQNVMQAVLWAVTFIQGDATMIMMVMYIMYTLNSAVSFIDSPWFKKEMRKVAE